MPLSREIEKLQRRWQENPLGLTFAPLAEAYRKEAMCSEALELLEIGLGQHPNYVPALIVRGRCYVDASDDSSAQTAFLRVVELDPENVIALKGLAEIADRAARFEEAASRLDQLLAFDRNNDEARAHLERVRAMLAIPSPGLVELEQAPPPFAAPEAPPPPLAPPPPGPSLDSDLTRAEVLSDDGDGLEFVRYDPVELEPAGDEAFELSQDPTPPEAPGLDHVSLDEPAPILLPGSGEESVGDGDASAPEPELVVTETMAELFLRQGHRELALAVYTQLGQREPGQPRIREAIERLSAELRPAAGPPTPGYAAAVTGGQSVGVFLEGLLSARPPADPAAGGPSLGAVFGDATSVAVEPPEPPESPERGPSFDEFFAGADAPAPLDPEAAPAPTSTPTASEDIEEFNAWLRGLKR